MISLNIALKNVRANKKRAAITILLLTFTTSLLVFASAFMDGSHHQMIRSAVEIYPGYIQITHKDFRKTPSYDHLIFDLAQITTLLRHTAGIESFSPRFESFDLFVTDEKSVGGMLTGIEPEKETKLSRLKSSLLKGRYLTEDDENAVYLGSDLAKRLKVDVGDNLAFIGSGADYSFAADNLTVVGIFQTGLYEFDHTAAFINKGYFDEIMASSGLATHIIVLPKNPDQSTVLAQEIQMNLPDEYQALDWSGFMSGMVEAMEVDSIFGYFTLATVFVVIFFVVVIYTMLALYSRIKEIGILRALGTTPRQIFFMLVLETIILGAMSVMLGGFVGGGFAYYFHLHPIVYSGYEEQFRQYGLVMSAMPSEFAPLTILRDMLIMFSLSIVANLYPVLKVNKYRPIEAINHV